jgi:hypothetical protein
LVSALTIDLGAGMTKPDGGAQREGLLGDIVDKVKDLITEDDGPKPVEVPELESDHRPAPEYGSPAGYPTSYPTSLPPSHHDSERQPPPPVSGSID